MAQAALLGASALGSGVSAFQSYKAGQVEQVVSNQQANLLDQTAKQALDSSLEDSRMIRRAGLRTMSSQAATYSASGVRLSGSPLLVIQETKNQTELDAMKTEYGGRLQATNLKNEATLRRFSGSQSAQAGTMGALSTLLTGGLQAYGAYKYGGTSYPSVKVPER